MVTATDAAAAAAAAAIDRMARACAAAGRPDC